MKKKQNSKAINEQKVSVNPEPEAPEYGDEPIDERAEINRLLDEGYSVKQIIDLGFKRRTVYHYAKQRVKPENEPAGDSPTADGAEPKVPTNKGKRN